MDNVKAAKLAAIGKMKGMFSKKLYKGAAGDEAEAEHGPLEEAAECNCGKQGCKDCAKSLEKNK
jgi:hypothetical protein